MRIVKGCGKNLVTTSGKLARGKYAGQYLEAVGITYLGWLLENESEMSEKDRASIRSEILRRRGGAGYLESLQADSTTKNGG